MPLPRRALLAAAPLLLAACATAPKPTPISSSRLGIAKSTGTVTRGVVQLEAGYSRAHQEGRTRQTFGETLLRIGLGPRTEGRLGLSSYLRTATEDGTVEGRGDGSVGMKHRLRDAAGHLPGIAFTLGTSIPTGVGRVGAGALQPEAGLSTEWLLPAGFRGLAAGSYRNLVNDDDRFGQATIAAGARRNLFPRTVGQLEYAFTHATRDGAADVRQVRASAGVRITPDLQLDAWAARATSAGVPETQLGIGFARRW